MPGQPRVRQIPRGIDRQTFAPLTGQRLPDYIEADTLPWEIQENEPSEWFTRFQAYMLMGANRSIHQVFRNELGWTQDSVGRSARAPMAPVLWQDAAKRWKWYQRAYAYDVEQARRERVRFEEERDNARRGRLALLADFEKKLKEAVNALNPHEATWRNVTQGIIAYVELQRVEYGDDPEQQDLRGTESMIDESDDAAEATAKLEAAISHIVAIAEATGGIESTE